LSVSSSYKLFVADLFAPFGEVNVRAMFGGGGIYHQGVMMGLIADEQIYLKVDEENRPAFEAADRPPFIFERSDGRQIAMSFYLAPDDIFDDPDALIDAYLERFPGVPDPNEMSTVWQPQQALRHGYRMHGVSRSGSRD
jgi:DNA transformation protein